MRNETICSNVFFSFLSAWRSLNELQWLMQTSQCLPSSESSRSVKTRHMKPCTLSSAMQWLLFSSPISESLARQTGKNQFSFVSLNVVFYLMFITHREENDAVFRNWEDKASKLRGYESVALMCSIDIWQTWNNIISLETIAHQNVRCFLSFQGRW